MIMVHRMALVAVAAMAAVTVACSSSPATGGASDAGASADGQGASVVPAKDLACTQVMGVSVTFDWFTHGFDTAPLDATRWQLRGVDVPDVSFIQEWSDPSDAMLWGAGITSPCVASSVDPDRIVFVGVNWQYTTAAQWVAAYESLIQTLQAKDANLKRVDLMTMLRAPGNMLCAGNSSQETVVAPFLDEAIRTVVANHPGLVTAAPPFYAPSCSVFLPNSPHIVPSALPAVAQVFRDYYASGQ
jgi:hypothetical protein